ncbi:MAG TPA: hypothetical protein VNX68_17395 [Nitrosopumilaceae archaeon]|jgi:hypothetical protein|nr:hypothetical protein [Nitrosopumilaceae archaeon]
MNLAAIPIENDVVLPESEGKAVLTDLSNHPDFKVTWDNRRRVITFSLCFCAVVITFILVVCGVSLFIGHDIEANVTSVFITCVTSTVFFSMGLIGSYVFGVSFETNNFRNKLVDLATEVAKK